MKNDDWKTFTLDEEGRVWDLHGNYLGDVVEATYTEDDWKAVMEDAVEQADSENRA